MLLLNLFPYFSCKLFSYIIHMGTSISCTNRIDKTYLLELSIWMCTDNFPVRTLIVNERELFVFFCVHIKLDVVFKIGYPNLLIIQENCDSFVDYSSHVICSFSEYWHMIIIKLIQLESFQIWFECNFSKIPFLLFVSNFGFSFVCHIVSPSLNVMQFSFRVKSFYCKLSWVDVCELSSIPITSPSSLLYIIIVVWRSKQTSKNQFRNP